MSIEVNREFLDEKYKDKIPYLVKTLDFIISFKSSRKKTTLKFSSDLIFSKLWLTMIEIEHRGWKKANGEAPKYVDKWKEAFDVLSKSTIRVEFSDDRKKRFIETSKRVLELYYNKEYKITK